MASIRSTFGSPELLVELDRSRPRGLRVQIEDALRASIRDGRLAAGTRLPSSRDLATDLGVTRGVIVSAYDQLVAEGYLTANLGSGTVVNEIADPRSVDEPVPAGPAIRFDLRSPVPDLDLFPRAAWNRSARAAMNAMARDDLGYVDSRGLARLRTGVADYLGRVRGVSTSPEQVMICNGFGHGYGIVLEALRNRGLRRIATEEPGYDDHRLIATRLGLATVPITVDDSGIDPDELANAAAGAVVITPAHQAPTGAVLSAERRTTLVEWARTSRSYIIEDDYDAEFRYDRQPVGALQGLASDRTIYIGTLSKSLAPGLRLGWVVLPHELIDDVTEVRRLIDGTTSTIHQATFAEFLERGDFDRHLRRARLEYRRRRDALLQALVKAIPAAIPGSVSAGLHVPVTLPLEVDEATVVDEARSLGVLVDSVGHFRSTSNQGVPTLIVGFGRVRTIDAAEAAGLLAEAVSRAAVRWGTQDSRRARSDCGT